MKSVIFGRYSNYNTPIHRIDPRVKIIGMIVFMVAIFLPLTKVGSTSQYEINMSTATNFIILGIIFLIQLILMLIGRISFISIFKSMKTMWFFLFLIFLLNILIPTNPTAEQTAFNLGSLAISYSAIFSTAYVFVRLVLVVMITSVVTSTTKPMELTFGIEWLLYPLKFVKIPVHEIGMIISLALRYIPTLMEESERIMKSQASRGVDFKNGKFKEKFKSITSLIVPLFMSSFIKASDLADTMEARGYDPKSKRTRYRMLSWRWVDTLWLIVIAIFLGLIIAQCVIGTNYMLLLLNII